jgi:flagellin
VGLLTVADGALSQVTNLLNRAVTLATEASNGTLNGSQDTAANQEYQSILSEISNIGSTTTYNNQAVFNSNTNIYTGDSTTTGSSVDALDIRTLSSSNVGDSGGVMSYSNGQNNVFLNLSSSTANAASSDTLNGGLNGTTTMTVNYLVHGANGQSSTATTTITAGGASGYANTAAGMVSAINNSGLGLTANFTTQTAAGVQGGGSQTGIEITGGLVSAGVDPNAASTSGTLNPSGISAGELLTQGQTISIKQGTTTAGTVTINSTINTLQEVANAINTGTGAGVTGFGSNQVTASVVTNGDGSQSLSLANTASTGGALTVTTTSGSTTAPAFATALNGSDAPNLATVSAGVAGVTASGTQAGSYTFGVTGTGNLGTDVLSAGGSITLTNSLASGSITDTFVVGAGTDTATTFYTANHGDNSNTVANLAATIQAAANLDVTTGVGTHGITVTSTTAAQFDNISSSANTLTNANSKLGLYSPSDGGSAVTGSATVTVLDSGGAAGQDDALTTGTHITLTQGANVMTFTAAAGQTYADLALAISSSTLGVNATWSSNTDGTAGHGGLVLTSKTNGVDTITLSNNNLADNVSSNSVIKDGSATAAANGAAGSAGSVSTAVLQMNNGGTITDASDTLTGSISLSLGGGATQTYVMGTGSSAGNTYYTGANTVASLLTAISTTNTNSGMTATVAGVQAGTGAIYLQANTVGAQPITVVGTTTLADVTGENENTNSNVAGASTTAATLGTKLISLASTAGLNGNGTVNTDDALGSGSVTIQNTGGGTAQTFTIVAANGTTGTAANTTYLAAGTTLSQLATSISGAGLGLTAQASTSGITVTQSTGLTGTVNITNSTLNDTSEGTYSSDTISGFANANDTVTGALNFSVGGNAKTLTLTSGESVSAMVTQINANSTSGQNLGVHADLVAGVNGAVSVKLTSLTEGAAAGNITLASASTIADTTSTANLTYTAKSAYNTGLSGSIADTSSGQTAATFASNTKAGSGTATISYSDGSGQSLANTDLTNQTDAQITLTSLNAAITAVAAQDGYIGAQINTLNAIGQVLSTQQENVVSAQNAVQATDYATATSNMSKYQILSQTGISALAQANSMEQEVTKLLQ